MEEQFELSDTAEVEYNKVIHSIPSPLQISNFIRKSGSKYLKEIMNPGNNAENYATSYKKAINLGIYGADLGYATVFEQTQDAIDYVSCTKKLADELDILGAFEISTIDRFQNNIGIKDSTMRIISEAFRNSDAYLKNNERRSSGALIMAGGWIEGLHIATTLAQSNKNKELIDRIAEQKISLDNLIIMLNDFRAETGFAELIAHLRDLQEAFKDVKIEYHYNAPVHSREKSMTRIETKSVITISDQQLMFIADKIKSLRNQLIK